MNTPYWLTEDSRKFLSRGYLKEGQTAEERIDEIALNAENILNKPGFAAKFRQYMYNGWISLASPIWSGFGTEKGLPISCNNSFFDDTTVSILEKTAEIGMMSKYGAGTSAYLGKIRPRGSPISVGGTSDGPVRFAELIETTTNVISQGSVRRGSCAVYLDIDHPDIEEFLQIREEGNFIQSLSFGVCISDDFMNKMIAGDKESREIWLKVLKKRFASGYPYLFFTDNVNKAKPQVYKDKDIKIYSSNLCVAGDTKILTSKGHIEISTLVDKEVEVWNGKEFSSTTVRKTGENKKLLRVSLSSGQYLDCTPEHRFYVVDKSDSWSKEMPAKNLKPEDRLKKFKFPVIEGKQEEAKEHIVISVEEIDGLHDTFCFTEPKRHMGVFNGILTGQCNEIALPSSPDESFVCCLSSVNLLHYDDWKDTDLIETMTYFLDAVMEEYIKKTEFLPFMQAAHKFAKRHRAIGLGVIGYHSLLQSKSIAFESFEAQMLNVEIFKLMNKKSLAATHAMAIEYGEPEILEGYGQRNATRLALAPTTSSSFIIGSGELSPSIEPNESNFYIADLAKGKFTVKNPHLKKVLISYEKDTQDIWDSIAQHGGSVYHLDFLSEHEKSVFRTFYEISQMEIVIQAAQRQKYIDQGQSLNLKISTSERIKDVNSLYIEMWKLGVKGAYYQRGMNPSMELKRNLLNCEACEA